MPDPVSSTVSSSVNACFGPEPSEASSGPAASTPIALPVFATSASESSPAPRPSAVQGLVNRFLVPQCSVSESKAEPRKPAADVLLCHRPADFWGNSVLQLQHRFVVTDSRAGGAGHCGGGIPGHGQVDLPFSEMCIIDHAPEAGGEGVVCDPVNADPECVNRELDFGQHIGRWAPPVNDCQTFAAQVLADCPGAPRDAVYSSGGAPATPSAGGDDGEGGARGY